LLGFTKSETRILFFLIGSFLIGCGVWMYRRWVEPLPVVMEDTSHPLSLNVNTDVSNLEKSEGDTLFRIILNTASKVELEKLPGVGPVMADRILEYRDMHRQFHSIEELKHIKGIGEKTIQKIEPYLTVN
jgi:comEA protein